MPTSMRSAALLLAAALWSVSSARAEEAGRILSIGGSITEIVYMLGQGDRLVAVDSTSLHPQEARELPNVGYMRALSAEPILALAPDLVLLDGDAGPRAVIDQITASGVDLVHLEPTVDVAGVPTKIRRVAEALGVAAAGEALATEVAAKADALSAQAKAKPRAPRVLFLLSVGKGAPLAAGRHTAAAGIIEAAGGVNAIDGYEGYKPLSPEAAVLANPEIILVPHRTVQQMGGADAILDRPEIASTDAALNRRLVAVDGLLVFGFGPRVAEAIEILTNAFHPSTETTGDSG